MKKIWGLMIMNNLSVTEKFFLAALGGATGLGNKSITSLVNFFGNAKAVWSADIADLHNAKIRRNSLEAFINFRANNPDAPEKLIEYCDQHKINVCSFFDEDYPPLLKEIDSPPVFFSIADNFNRLQKELQLSAHATIHLMGKTLRLSLPNNLRRRA